MDKKINNLKIKNIVFSLFVWCFSVSLFGQVTVSGKVSEKNSNLPLEFVNIGIVGKNIGTVSDRNGNYSLQIEPKYENDTLKFSSIGYHSCSVKVSDFIKQNNSNVNLEKKIHELKEVTIRPKKLKSKTLGITTKSPAVQGGLVNVNGYEIGVLINNKRTAFVKEVNINVIECSYDSIFFRINIYTPHKETQFENILHKPVYAKFSKQNVKDKITIDLRHLNLAIKGDFLVTIECVQDLGGGKILFPAKLFSKTYIRQTSQGAWETQPVGMSLSVLVDVEK